MSVRIEFTQKKNGTFLVAAFGDQTNRGETREVFQAVPLKDAEAFVNLLKTSDCSGEVISVLTEAARTAGTKPDSPVTCGALELRSNELARLGLTKATSIRDLAVA